MTSGTFHSISISTITVNREGRQRRELGNLDDLSNSIHRLGLIHPIVVTRDLVLVAGERRLAACRSLGHTHIACQYVDEVDQTVLHAIELEENIKRSNLTWQEECKAIYDYDQYQKGLSHGWSEAKTAEALGLSQQSVNNKITVARELLRGNELVVKAPKYSTALGSVERAAVRRDEEALSLLRTIETPEIDGAPDPILNTSFLEWAPTYTGIRFNFVHCDFPYGIGADKFVQGGAATHGGYKDTEATYWDLCNCLAENLDRITTESCHFMFWFSMHFYTETLDFFHKNTDIELDPFPLIWHKTDNAGILPDPQRGPRRIYETAFFGSRGDRKIVSAKSNAYGAPTDRSQHMSIKPESMLRYFFSMFVDTSSIVLDPTCGSGSALRAAESLNASYVLGLELNPDFAKAASDSIKAAKSLKK